MTTGIKKQRFIFIFLLIFFLFPCANAKAYVGAPYFAPFFGVTGNNNQKDEDAKSADTDKNQEKEVTKSSKDYSLLGIFFIFFITSFTICIILVLNCKNKDCKKNIESKKYRRTGTGTTHC